MPAEHSSYRPVSGSHRRPVPGAVRLGDADPAGTVPITVVLRPAGESGSGADPAAVAAVEAFAQVHGLTVSDVHAAARTVGLVGTVAQMNAAFQVDLGEYHVDDVRYRGREGEVHVPAELADTVLAILGLDNRPQARAQFRRLNGGGGHAAVGTHAASAGYAPRQVAQRYGFPTDVDGTGQTVAIIELGGGYRHADLAAYFSAAGLRTPAVTAVSVDGAHNKPGGDADAEVALDIEVIGAVAQGAAITVYFGPNTDQGFYDAISKAVHDPVRKPSVISISWGQAEAGWTVQAMTAYDALFADASAAGVTVYAAAGDDGAADGVQDGQWHVDFPASSPNVVACGGTRLGSTTETVWNALSTGHGATGGGVSRQFARPAYQHGANVPTGPGGTPGRGVPDVAGDADPATGYLVRVDGTDEVIGGTSAVAPLWAALTALVNQRSGRRTGAPHARLYADPSALRDIRTGDNGGYHAGSGWDPCTGLGVPDGDRTVAALGAPA